MASQLRNRMIAMTSAEVDEFLTGERVCRIATVTASGKPHVSPVWFVWDGLALWMWSLENSRRWRSIASDPHVSVVIDGGVDYFELRGVELEGSVELVGADPTVSGAVVGEAGPDVLFADKYLGGTVAAPDGRHGWMRLVPHNVVSWDFRKIRAGAAS